MNDLFDKSAVLVSVCLIIDSLYYIWFNVLKQSNQLHLKILFSNACMKYVWHETINFISDKIDHKATKMQADAHLQKVSLARVFD